MRFVMMTLCLALIAGLTFATLAPAPVQVDKLEAMSLINLPEPSPIVDDSQKLFCGPWIGDCNDLTWEVCDCDVPTPDWTCADTNGRYWQVFTCYGRLYCYLGAYCPG